MINKHPEWLQQFKDLGLKINIWTIDDAQTMRHYVDKGVDFITTNEPELCKTIVKK
jgi:glycerophosphoryl diester phosphodiesterase